MVRESPSVRLRRLHEEPPLILPNAWDAASAAIVERAGAKAIATTSAGIAWSLGVPDGQQLGRDDMLAALARIAGTARVPVTADIEGGYGDGTPADVVATVDAVMRLGVAGINLEDSPGVDGAPLLAPEAQAERITAARTAAGEDLFINARVDSYLFEVGPPEGRLDDVVFRAKAYLEAGADSIFVPGPVDLPTIGELAARIDAPLNIMVGPGAPTVTELTDVGVARISVGPAITLAALSASASAARELLDRGSYANLENALSFSETNTLFSRATQH